MESTGILSLGERRVGIQFNTANDDIIDQIKQKTAELINLLQALRNSEVSKTYDKSPEAMQELSGEKLRVIALAQTSYEEAATWVDKVATA